MTHCETLMNGAEIIVRDLDSSNGTFVDGMRLNKQSQARSGLIRFGLVEARLELEPQTYDERSTSITAVLDTGEIPAGKAARRKETQAGRVWGKSNRALEVEMTGHTVLLPRPARPTASPEPTQDTEVERRRITPKSVILIGRSSFRFGSPGLVLVEGEVRSPSPRLSGACGGDGNILWIFLYDEFVKRA